jgi:hypothetical protein
MQTRGREFYATVIFERRDGDHFYIHSPDIPGLHLAGRNFDALQGLLEPAIRDLYWFNSKIAIDGIRLLPSLNEVNKLMKGPADLPSGGEPQHRVYEVTVNQAA